MLNSQFQSVEKYFKDKLNRKFCCIKCDELLFNALQSSCGCFRCCESCVISRICEDCNKEITFFPDKALSKELKNIKLQCYFEGCQEMIPYQSFLAHITECRFRMIECAECHDQVPLSDLNNHKEKECDRLMKQCVYCNEFVQFSRSKHVKCGERIRPECRELVGDCINCDAKEVKLWQHYLVCQKIPCLFKQYGCKGYQGSKSCTMLSSHIDILSTILQSFRENSQNLPLQNGTREPNEKHSLILKDVDYLEAELASIRQIIDNNLKLYEIPKRGKYIWRLTNMEAVLRSKDPLLSEPMYNDEYGYKLCLKIYPNGDGIGQGEYISVYYVIMKGKYDELLTWPFNRKVKITIYNQKDVSKSKTELYRPGHLSDSNRKPTSEMNLATGNPKFLRLTDLNDNGYILDETMFVEISVLNDKTFL